MLRSASKIIGHRLHAVDGEIGRATDFLLDEQGWFLRYMVVETGRWHANRRVLISPMGLRKAEWTSRRLVLDGTREQVRAAPVLSEDGTAPRQDELSSPAEAGLHSITEVLGFGLHVTDGSVGHVEDVIVDDDTWTSPYLVVDSRSWLSGRRKVLVATERVGQIDWSDGHVDVLLPRWEIEESPEFDPTAPVYHRQDEPFGGDPAGTDRAEPNASFFRFNPPEGWRTRGLRAALARIIHG